MQAVGVLEPTDLREYPYKPPPQQYIRYTGLTMVNIIIHTKQGESTLKIKLEFIVCTYMYIELHVDRFK